MRSYERTRCNKYFSREVHEIIEDQVGEENVGFEMIKAHTRVWRKAGEERLEMPFIP